MTIYLGLEASVGLQAESLPFRNRSTRANAAQSIRTLRPIRRCFSESRARSLERNSHRNSHDRSSMRLPTVVDRSGWRATGTAGPFDISDWRSGTTPRLSGDVCDVET